MTKVNITRKKFIYCYTSRGFPCTDLLVDIKEHITVEFNKHIIKSTESSLKQLGAKGHKKYVKNDIKMFTLGLERWFRALAALPGDLSLTPNMHMEVHSCLLHQFQGIWCPFPATMGTGKAQGIQSNI